MTCERRDVLSRAVKSWRQCGAPWEVSPSDILATRGYREVGADCMWGLRV